VGEATIVEVVDDLRAVVVVDDPRSCVDVVEELRPEAEDEDPLRGHCNSSTR
jgi:hypothetical protein